MITTKKFNIRKKRKISSIFFDFREAYERLKTNVKNKKKKNISFKKFILG